MVKTYKFRRNKRQLHAYLKTPILKSRKRFFPYLLQLAPALGQQDNLVIEGFPSLGFVAELQDVGDGFLGTGHVVVEPHLLLHVQKRLYLRLQIACDFLQKRKTIERKYT